jgi:hypothetical protein
MARRKGKKRKPPPVCKAILLCDAVLTDPFTGKGSVIGILSQFVVPAFPGESPPFFVYLQLTNGIGRYTLSIELRDRATDAAMHEGTLMDLEFAERATKNIVVIPMPPLPLPHAGAYDFIVFAEGQEIDRQQFDAVMQEPSDGEE